MCAADLVLQSAVGRTGRQGVLTRTKVDAAWDARYNAHLSDRNAWESPLAPASGPDA